MDPLLRCSLSFLLLYFLTLVPVTVEGHGGVLRRQKREWILAPRNLTEGHDYTTFDYVAKIRSDKETSQEIMYSLTGCGVDQPPQGRFSVDRKTGFVKVHSILDREEIAQYSLLGVAKYYDGTRAENDITLIINVLDINDCTPVIKMQQVGEVSEHSKIGTIVMKVIATDDDDPSTSNARIFYRIDESTNAARMFIINSQTGEVMVAKTTLDRETQSIYKLTILASDMGGGAGGLTGTGEIEIRLTDINDNIPTLAQETYEGRVEENTIGVEVLRIQAVDLDLIQTDNWWALFEIVSGNEGGYFEIRTDKETNEGVITIVKALDYEEIKTLNLGIKVKNVAEYNFGSSMVTSGASAKSYPIKINVVNQKEGARFQPSVKVVDVSEEITSTSLTRVIATYAAIDSDTLKTATNVRYAKLYDADNWFSINEKTAEIRLNKHPDRESIHLVNGTYYGKIICISDDVPAKTATGTIAIQVQDFNDHCPHLTSTAHTMCLGENVIYVTARDEDLYPNTHPFTFDLIQVDGKDKWILEPFNETTVLLRNQGKLWNGNYKVSLNVKDQQGKSCDNLQKLNITVCTCDGNTKACSLSRKSNVKFGAGGILLLLLGLLLLLLIPLLLLFCLCGNAARDFKTIPFEANEHLISYHTEGQGEDKDVPLVQVPVHVDGSTINTKNINMSGGAAYLDNLTGAGMGGGGTLTGEEMWMDNKHNYYHANRDQMGFMGAGTMTGQQMGFMGTGTMTGKEMSFSKHRLTAFDGMALPEHYLGQYYSVKSRQAPQQHLEKDKEVIYEYEGEDSKGGSVGCCSLLENEDDLAFLNDLGPKFKTLAEICNGTPLESTSVDVGLSNLSNQTGFTARPSTSTHTQVHTHTETIRDREPVNVNTLNTSNKASGSSTLIQKERITERSKGSATPPKVKETVVIPSQTLLIQQPAMYYAAAPMYVVESNPQMVLVSGGTQQVVGQVSQPGLSQGLIQVGGLQGSQGVVLVEGQMGMNGVSGQVAQGSSQGAISTTSTQMFVVENGSSAGKHSTQYLQSPAHAPQRSSQAGFEVGGKGVQVKSFSAGSRGSAGSKEDFTLATTPRLQGGQRVVVQHKKVSMTERNIESST